MAVSPPFFSKRDPEPLQPRTPPPVNAPLGNNLQRPAVPTGSSTTSTYGNAASNTSEGGSKLTVGPNIKLKGVEITDCDTLVVEGTVEATMDSRVIHIAEQGAFRGAVEIDIAEIYGSFDGDLTVRDKLVIFGTGRVSGKIRYGKLVIEEGGQLSGEIAVVTDNSKPRLKASSGASSSASTSSSSATPATAG